MLPSTEARKGELVTIFTDSSIGVGYLVDGEVWKPSGSYWAVKASEDIFPMTRFERDNGEGYLEAVRSL